MEPLTEIRFCQERQTNQRQSWHNNPVGTSGANFQEDPPQNWYPRRQTGWSRTHTSSGSYGGDSSTQDKRPRGLCRDFLEGKCTRKFCKFLHESGGRNELVCRDFIRGNCKYGASCKFSHSKIEKHDESSSFGNRNVGYAENVGTSQFCGGNTDDYSRGTSFHRNFRTRSPCRNFQVGRCRFGADCLRPHIENTTYVRSWHARSPERQQEVPTTSKNLLSRECNSEITTRTPQGCDDSYKANNLSTRSPSRMRWDKSACRNFLRGVCRNGATCPRLHIEHSPSVGSMHNWTAQHSQENAATSENHDFDKESAGFTLSKLQGQGESNKDDHFPTNHRSKSPCRKFLRGDCSRGASCRYLHIQPGEFGDHRKREVCLKFTMGRCSFGESCKYLHGFHAYASSDPNWNKHFEAAAASKKYDETHKYDPSMMHQEHAHNEVNNVQLSEYMYAGSGVESRDGYPNDNKKRQSAGARMSNGDTEKADDDNLSLWSQPFKRQRSNWSRPPFTPRDGFDCRTISKVESENNFSRDRRNNVVPFRFPYHGSCQYNCRRYQTDNPTHSKVSAMAGDSCFKKNCKVPEMKKMTGDEEVKIHGVLLDKCARGPLVSNTEFLNPKCESEDAKDTVQLSNVVKVKDSMGSKVVGSQVERSQEGSEVILNLKSEVECVKGDIKISRMRYDDMELRTGSSETDFSQEQKAINPKVVESYYLSSCEMDKVSPMGTDVGVLSDGNNGKVNVKTEQEGGEEVEVTKTHRDGHFGCCVVTVKEEVTDLTMQRLSCSFAGDSHPDIVSAVKVADDMKISPQNSAVQNLLTVDHPAQQLEPGLGTINHKIQNSQLVPAVMEDGTMLFDHSVSHSLRTLIPSSEAAMSNYKKKLLILDVNGILADIVADFPSSCKPDTLVSMKAVFKRPFCDEFLEFCFERFDVGVWSSRNKKNVDKVVDFLFGDTKNRLLFCWDQAHCTETGLKTVENREKPLVLKELKKLWEKQVPDLPWEKGYYNETNTVLLDDSPYKALRNPPYTAVFPYPYSFKDVKDKSIGPGGDLRVYLERLAAADNVQKFIQENRYGQRPITKRNPSWEFYKNIIYPSQNDHYANVIRTAPYHPRNAS